MPEHSGKGVAELGVAVFALQFNENRHPALDSSECILKQGNGVFGVAEPSPAQSRTAERVNPHIITAHTGEFIVVKDHDLPVSREPHVKLNAVSLRGRGGKGRD